MTVYGWQIVCLVARYKSISAVAKMHNLTPSTVSHMVKKIEEEVGYPLFIRNQNKFDLTDDGKALFPFITNLINAKNVLDEEILFLRDKLSSSVCIATYNTVINNYLTDIFKAFNKKQPLVNIIIRQSNDVQIKKWLDNHEINLAVVFNSYFNNSTFIPLHRIPVVCFTSEKFFPENGHFMSKNDLEKLPIILRTENFDRETNQILANYNIVPKSIIRIDNDESCYELIRQGYGFRITASFAYLGKEGLNQYELINAPSRTLGIITNDQTVYSPAVNLFQKEIINYFSSNNLLNV